MLIEWKLYIEVPMQELSVAYKLLSSSPRSNASVDHAEDAKSVCNQRIPTFVPVFLRGCCFFNVDAQCPTFQ